jgi:hypothetical protein
MNIGDRVGVFVLVRVLVIVRIRDAIGVLLAVLVGEAIKLIYYVTS